MAVSCIDVFPTVLSSSADNGKANLNRIVRLTGTVDGNLNIGVEQPGNQLSCDGEKCKDSGVRAKSLDLPQFKKSSSKVDKATGHTGSLDLAQGPYRNVEVDFQSTLRFSKNNTVTYIKNLKVVDSAATIIFEEGVYWIENFQFNYKTNIIINGDDKVTLIIKNSSFTSNHLSFNVDGTPEQLVLIAYNNINLPYLTRLNGFVYAKKNIELDNASAFEGAINGKNITLNYNAAVKYAPDSIKSANFNGFCSIDDSILPAPTLEYRFDECSYTGLAGDVIDETGDFNGSSNGIPNPINDAIINKSLDLSADGTSDWINVPSSAVDGLNDFSVSVWFKTAVNKNQQEIFHALGGDDWGDDEDELEIFLREGEDWWDDDIVYIKVKGDKKEINSNIKLTNNTWHHLVLTREAYSVCLFIDGVLQQCVSVDDADALSVNRTNAVVIGQEQDSFGGDFSTSQNFEGLLDEFKIFDVKLSDTDIASIYQNELAGNNFDGFVRTPVQCDNSCGTTPGQLNAVGIKIGGGGSNFQINTTTEALSIYDAWLAAGSPVSGFIGNRTYVAASGSSTVDRIDFGGSSHDFSGTLPYPGVGAGVSGSDFLVHTSGTLSLPAGDYTIFVESDDGFSFVMNSLSGDSVSFNKFGNSTSGEPNELRYELPTGNSNTGGSFTLSQDSVFDIAAIFYERGGGDYLEISIANDLRTNFAPRGYEILREGALSGKVKLGLCSALSEINHYQIIHDGQGLTCEAEQIIIQACTNSYDGSCTLSSEDVTLDVTATGPNGRSSADSVSLVTGTGTANIAYTFDDLTTLSLSSAGTNSTVCINGGSASCDLVFANAGFRFLSGVLNETTIPNQIAGIEFPKALKVQAVENTNGVCTGLFINAKSVNLSQENIAPNGNGGLYFNVDNKQIAKYPNTTNTSLTFGANSIATIPTPVYQDAGQIRLHADYDDGTVQLTGSSNPFWVSPDRLAVIAKSGSINLDGSTAAAITTHKAGEDFDLIVSAYNANNVITPNYSPGQMQLKLERTGPTLTGSLDGNFSYAAASTLQSSTTPAFTSVSLANFVSGVSTYSEAKYSEVGLLNLDIQDSNYGHVGITVDSAAIDIGRFTPDHFKQTVAENGGVFTTCGAGTSFAYTGQTDALVASIGAISYKNQPILEITAYNKQGVITRNYDGNFIKLSAGDVSVVEPTFDAVNNSSLAANIDTGILSQIDLTALSSGTALAKGILHYQFSALDHFVYSRGSGTEVAPYTSAFELAVDTISDADSIDLLPSDGSARTATAAIPNGVEVRFGRLVLQNSFGPTAVNLTQPLQVEYFNGSNFVVSSDDNCLGYEDSRLSSSPDIDALGGTGIFIDGETRSIQLDGQDTDSSGEIRVSYDTYDWLKYDWDNGGDYNDNPSAIATFGLFRGNDRVIYRRVVN